MIGDPLDPRRYRPPPFQLLGFDTAAPLPRIQMASADGAVPQAPSFTTIPGHAAPTGLPPIAQPPIPVVSDKIPEDKRPGVNTLPPAAQGGPQKPIVGPGSGGFGDPVRDAAVQRITNPTAPGSIAPGSPAATAAATRGNEDIEAWWKKATGNKDFMNAIKALGASIAPPGAAPTAPKVSGSSGGGGLDLGGIRSNAAQMMGQILKGRAQGGLLAPIGGLIDPEDAQMRKRKRKTPMQTKD